MSDNISNSLIEAIDILSQASARNMPTTLTIECSIVSQDNLDKGLYTVRYLDNNFSAYSISNDIYDVNSYVFVLIPDGDFTKNKIILAPSIPTVKNKGGGDGDLSAVIDEEKEMLIFM